MGQLTNGYVVQSHNPGRATYIVSQAPIESDSNHANLTLYVVFRVGVESPMM